MFLLQIQLNLDSPGYFYSALKPLKNSALAQDTIAHFKDVLQRKMQIEALNCDFTTTNGL